MKEGNPTSISTFEDPAREESELAPHVPYIGFAVRGVAEVRLGRK